MNWIGKMARRTAVLVGFCASLAACTTPYEGRYDFYDGWRKAEVTGIDLFEKLPPHVARHCRASPSLYAAAGTTWAVVRYRLGGRSRLAAAPVPQSERFKVGELVYANVSECAPELRKRVAAG